MLRLICAALLAGSSLAALADSPPAPEKAPTPVSKLFYPAYKGPEPWREGSAMALIPPAPIVVDKSAPATTPAP